MLDVSPDFTPSVAPPQDDLVPAPLLQARALGFSIDAKPLIDGVDVEFQRGSRTVILGPNGAGKSLLLRLLHGLIPPTSGRVLWHGRSLDRAGRRAQAMVFQRPVMLRRSVMANVRFALDVRGVGSARRQAQKHMELAQLAAFAKQPARALSVGEQQRLAVVRALACEPEVLFLDEPTASLDPASTHAIEALIGEAHRNGVTIVMVTHDVGQARRIGETALFLHRGRIVETGDVEQVLDRPNSPAARAWLQNRLYLEPAK